MLHFVFKQSIVALHQFVSEKKIILESGVALPRFNLGYTTYGSLNATRDNVVWVFHALTANSDPAEWWPLLVGEKKLLNPEEYFIICVNMPGSCYGSIGPLDADPVTGKPYLHNFPFFTTRDMIRMYQSLRRSLEINKIKIGIGGSMGGQQLLEWAIEEPELFEYIFPLATNACHSAWGRAFNASQRFAIETDPSWMTEDPLAGIEGMKVARSIALLSYRHYETYRNTQNEIDESKLTGYKSESYQKYQGEKLSRRFNAFSYYFLSKSMDAHNVGRGRGTAARALKQIQARTTVIGIESDILFPVAEQQFIADHVTGAELEVIQSHYGHDGFLLEFYSIENIIKKRLAANPAVMIPSEKAS